MPHSSGGGSHGGGGHGGGSHGTGSRGFSGPAVRSTYFPGSMRYVYYANRMPHYIYTTENFTQRMGKKRYLSLLIYFPMLAIILGFLVGAVHNPKKLSMAYNTDIVISDKAYVLDADASLKATLTAFRDKTGITPAVITVNNESWQGHYNSLEQYAYDLYVNAFADESHFLIVYSTSRPNNGYIDWYWEGMQGDDTDSVLTSSVLSTFNSELQKNLTARSRFTVSKAIETAFQAILPTVMKTTVQWSAVITALFMIAFIICHAYFMLGFNPKAKQYRTAVPCPEVLTEQAVCEYCDGVYVVGTCTTCPHCGANLKPHSFYSEPDAFPFQPADSETTPTDDP